MKEVIGIVDIRAAQGRADEVVSAFEECITRTHEEEGCLMYALHRDVADPYHLVMVERWRSQADLDEHMTKPYVADLFALAGTPGVLAAPPQITFASSLGLGSPAKSRLG